MVSVPLTSQVPTIQGTRAPGALYSRYLGVSVKFMEVGAGLSAAA